MPQELNITRAPVCQGAEKFAPFRCRCLPRWGPVGAASRLRRPASQPPGSPREGPLLQRAPSRRMGQPPTSPTPPPGGPGRRKRLGVRRAPAREARSEPGRVATLTSPSTVTSLRNPVRARGGAARSTGPRRRGRATSTSRRAPRKHAADGARAPPRSKQIHCHRREFPIARPITTVTREPKGKEVNPCGGPENTKRLWGWAHFGSTAETLHTIGRYSC